jgi:hypothetical protein
LESRLDALSEAKAKTQFDLTVATITAGVHAQLEFFSQEIGRKLSDSIAPLASRIDAIERDRTWGQHTTDIFLDHDEMTVEQLVERQRAVEENFGGVDRLILDDSFKALRDQLEMVYRNIHQLGSAPLTHPQHVNGIRHIFDFFYHDFQPSYPSALDLHQALPAVNETDFIRDYKAFVNDYPDTANRQSHGGRADTLAPIDPLPPTRSGAGGAPAPVGRDGAPLAGLERNMSRPTARPAASSRMPSAPPVATLDPASDSDSSALSGWFTTPPPGKTISFAAAVHGTTRQPASTPTPTPMTGPQPQLTAADLGKLSKDDLVKTINTQFGCRIVAKGKS